MKAAAKGTRHASMCHLQSFLAFEQNTGGCLNSSNKLGYAETPAQKVSPSKSWARAWKTDGADEVADTDSLAKGMPRAKLGKTPCRTPGSTVSAPRSGIRTLGSVNANSRGAQRTSSLPLLIGSNPGENWAVLCLAKKTVRVVRLGPLSDRRSVRPWRQAAATSMVLMPHRVRNLLQVQHCEVAYQVVAEAKPGTADEMALQKLRRNTYGASLIHPDNSFMFIAGCTVESRIVTSSLRRFSDGFVGSTSSVDTN